MTKMTWLMALLHAGLLAGLPGCRDGGPSLQPDLASSADLASTSDLARGDQATSADLRPISTGDLGTPAFGVACQGQQCTDKTCCGNGSGTVSCEDSASPACGPNVPVRYECDGTEDCSGYSCIGARSAVEHSEPLKTHCGITPGPAEVVVCRSDEDCVFDAGTHCAPITPFGAGVIRGICIP